MMIRHGFSVVEAANMWAPGRRGKSAGPAGRTDAKRLGSAGSADLHPTVDRTLGTED